MSGHVILTACTYKRIFISEMFMPLLLTVFTLSPVCENSVDRETRHHENTPI